MMIRKVCSSRTKETWNTPVREAIAELTRRLIAEAAVSTDTTVYLNARQRPWKKVTGVARFVKIKRELGWDQDDRRASYSSYTCRRTFACVGTVAIRKPTSFGRGGHPGK
ncbi:MAG: hypothetical protein H6822_27135 [Planctomycetaceae bacterium]|nr:hypothetical protein [Planctomycetales bacterium]MCB9925854.1 hypothetical protein [Planctomycetaceae bacterium]